MMIMMIKIKAPRANQFSQPSHHRGRIRGNLPQTDQYGNLSSSFLNEIVQQAAQLRFPSGAMSLGDQQCHFPSCDRHIKIIPRRRRKEDSGRLLLAPTYPGSHTRDMVQLDAKLAPQLSPDAQQRMAFRTGRTSHQPLLDLEGAAA